MIHSGAHSGADTALVDQSLEMSHDHPRFRIREGLFARAAFPLVAYRLAASALLLLLFLPQAYSRPAIEQLEHAKISAEPAFMALLGTGLLCAHLLLPTPDAAPTVLEMA